MTNVVNRIFSFALLAVTAAVGAAQAEQHATFHLPFEAKWGGVLLPPGDYKLTMPPIATGSMQFYVNGKTARGFIAPMTSDLSVPRVDHAVKSYLRLVKVDDLFYVSKFESGPNASAFSFRVPKPHHQVQMSSAEVVDLGVAGN